MSYQRLQIKLGLYLLILSQIYPCYSARTQDTTISASPWSFTLGAKYWLSTSTIKEQLFENANKDSLVSRITFSNMIGNAAESFWQLKHTSGLFFQGYFGGASLNNGHMNDEDFPPEIVPYSNTLQQQRYGSFHYLSIDFGYQLYEASKLNLSTFVGYYYRSDRLYTFGCQQVADNPLLCTDTLPQYQPIPDSLDLINLTPSWNSLRLGGVAEIQLSSSLHLVTDIAYLRTYLNALDYHNLRPDIRPLLIDGVGNGFQLDALFTQLLTPELSVGLGVRWWYSTTSGFARFEQTYASGQPQPMDVTQNQYGLLIETNYAFDKNPSEIKSSNILFNWSGFYAGANIGYGTAPVVVFIQPASSLAQFYQELELTPLNLNVQNAGFFGGGQVGYNWRKQNYLFGIEINLDDASIGGANAVTSISSGIPYFTTTVTQDLNWIGSLRGRLGRFATETILVYLDAGPAQGQVTRSFDQRIHMARCNYGVCSTMRTKSIKTGYTVGGGLEYSISTHATFKVEYQYLSLGTVNDLIDGWGFSEEPISYNTKANVNRNLISLGVNYKFLR